MCCLIHSHYMNIYLPHFLLAFLCPWDGLQVCCNTVDDLGDPVLLCQNVVVTHKLLFFLNNSWFKHS